MSHSTEYAIPAALLAAALLAFVGFGFYAAGPGGALVVMTTVGVSLALATGLGIVACFMAAKILGTSYGPLGTGVLKLAAIIAFSSAVSLFIPYVGWLASLLLYYGLLSWLFDLDAIETIVTALVIWAVRMLAFFGIALLLS